MSILIINTVIDNQYQREGIVGGLRLSPKKKAEWN